MGNNAFKSEDILSAISAKLDDFTAVQIMTAREITSGAGASGTATILGIGAFSVNNIWIDVTSTTVNAASTGCEARLFGRPASGVSWVRFKTDSGLASSTYLIPVKGSGTDMSGVSYYGDLKVELYNISSSGTCVANIYALSKRLT